MLFEAEDAAAAPNSTTFIDNMKLPVHRWFRYSAGFSAQWAESLITEQRNLNGEIRVLDPFAGSGTTLLAAQDVGIVSYGVESHPFVARIARAKLARHSDPKEYRSFARNVLKSARLRTGSCEDHAPLIKKCYTPDALTALDCIRGAYEHCRDASAASELTWLTLLGILRKTSHVGTANWQYVLPKKSKKGAVPPFDAFEEQIEIVHRDMLACQDRPAAAANLVGGDARNCDGVPASFANLVITSPPYPNNYDYADATRLEMTFMREIEGWGDLHDTVRKHLVVSCSQHVPEKAVDLSEVMKTPEIAPIRQELSQVCQGLAEIRLSKGGKKTYHLMVACYFRDLARVWIALRRVCDTPCTVCFVLGDSAPYGVYVPVMDWMGRLAVAAGFADFRFEKLRDRNIKWKNRKHRVPLSEGRLWISG
jgi:hypothetical protein